MRSERGPSPASPTSPFARRAGARWLRAPASRTSSHVALALLRLPLRTPPPSVTSGDYVRRDQSRTFGRLFAMRRHEASPLRQTRLLGKEALTICQD